MKTDSGVKMRALARFTIVLGLVLLAALMVSAPTCGDDDDDGGARSSTDDDDDGGGTLPDDDDEGDDAADDDTTDDDTSDDDTGDDDDDGTVNSAELCMAYSEELYGADGCFDDVYFEENLNVVCGTLPVQTVGQRDAFLACLEDAMAACGDYTNANDHYSDEVQPCYGLL
ncbi:MAG: hypothetical protein H6684_00185 [Deltaproteobacteria bacterium]|nr:hypothetical protein [Deltaproteobacteria bacterium]MCB9480068.1 hypothetical protein [Deltaproteobacteria bacterium]MCB9487126.1 hypothetical protein [Deltaproteobacteria bacterium]